MDDVVAPPPAGSASAGAREVRAFEWTLAALLALAGGYLAGTGSHLLLAVLLGGMIAAAALTRPGPILLAYLIYMPFEEFVLKWIPEGSAYMAMRYGPEIGLYGVLLAVLWTRGILGERPVIRRTPIDVPVAIFIGVALLSALVSGAPVLLVVHGLRWLLRYLVVYYLVVHLDWDENRKRRWITALLAVAAIQAGIGMIQSAVGRPAWDLLAADYSKRGWVTDEVKLDPNYRRGVFATMGSYFALGTYLSLWITIALGLRWSTRSRRWLVAAALLAVGLFLSYSRQATLGLMIAGTALAWLHGRRTLIAIVLLLVLAYFGAGAYVFLTDAYIPGSNIDRPLHERFLGPFTREYWRIDYTFHGRSYLLFDVGGRLLADAPLLGQGPGVFGTQASLTYGSPVYERLKIDPRNVFDVYWIAVLGQVGLLGVVAFLWMLVAVGRAAIRRARAAPSAFERGLGLGLGAAVVGIVIACFFGPSLSDRYLSLYFWLLAGLATVGSSPAADRRAA
jgi:hypothetical protein